MADHALVVDNYPGTYGDHPTPWQRDYSCICGEEFGFDEEGHSEMSFSEIDELFARHVREEEEEKDDEEQGDLGSAPLDGDHGA